MKKRQLPARPRSLRDLSAMSASERETERAAFHALELMRHDGLSLTHAARRAGTRPDAVIRHVGPALVRRGSRWVALPSDRLLRAMVVLTEGGVEHEVAIRGSRVASLVGAHWSAIGHYLDTGEAGRLEAFQGKRAAGYVLESEPVMIDAWARRGEVDIEDVYSLTS